MWIGIVWFDKLCSGRFFLSYYCKMDFDDDGNGIDVVGVLVIVGSKKSSKWSNRI